ncbi:IS110 family transposase, partial [bacterium M00.F.Ca.ET.155.01.1.1]
RAPAAKRVVFETGPLSVWFYRATRGKAAIKRARPLLPFPPLEMDAW